MMTGIPDRVKKIIIYPDFETEKEKFNTKINIIIGLLVIIINLLAIIILTK
jgi:hypothetical protein